MSLGGVTSIPAALFIKLPQKTFQSVAVALISAFTESTLIKSHLLRPVKGHMGLIAFFTQRVMKAYNKATLQPGGVSAEFKNIS